MIERRDYRDFAEKLYGTTDGLKPLSGQLELTYRCNLNCIHCYCKGSEEKNELTLSEWRGIIDQLHAAGTIWLTITGGEPLLRDDFFKVYRYARDKGFLVTVFTNGILLNDRAIDFLSKYPPYSMEITLNGIREATYESISNLKGSFKKALKNIEKVVSKGLPLVLKAVGLKQNRDEIYDIKAFAGKLLGEKKFKFDSFITPRLTTDKTPCLYRLSADEIERIEAGDRDMRAQREEEFKKDPFVFREAQYKYRCNSWFKQFYITPDGTLRFCHLTGKYSSDLRRVSFSEGFYGKFPDILLEKHTTHSRCINCELREFCYHCPARAYLETGDEEAAVLYYCKLARARKESIEEARKRQDDRKEGIQRLVA